MIRVLPLLMCLVLTGCGSVKPGTDADRWTTGAVLHNGQPFHTITMRY